MALKTLELDKTQALNVIYDFFKDFSKWISQSKTLSVGDLEIHLGKNFHLTSNGHAVSKSTTEYLKRYQTFQKKYSRFEISKSIDEPLVSGNRIAFHYKVDLTTHNNQHKQVYIAAVVTIEDKKIVQWEQIAHEIGAGDWDT